MYAHGYSSHELYVYANTYDMYKTFAPRLNGRYLSSNVNITVLDAHGNNVSVPVGGTSNNLPPSSRSGRRLTWTSMMQ